MSRVSTVRLARLLTPGVIAALLLGGCAGTTVPQEHFYQLPVDVGSTAGTSGSVGRNLPGIISVQRFDANALLAQRPLVFAEQTAPHALQQYHYHFWVDPPPRMLQELTVVNLRSAGVAQEVVTSDTRALAAYELKGKIKHLEHLRGKAAAVHLSIEFSFSRLADGKLLWVKEFGSQQPAADESIASATQAMGSALRVVFEQLTQSIGEE